MKIATLETIPVSVPYRHREVSSQVARDGVSDVLVKLTTDEGHIGWGEACCGADTASVEAALRAMAPFVLGRDPWNREAMRRDVFTHGLWQFRSGTGNFAWAGIDMALWDICGRACGQPLWRLLGGLQQSEATYFYYLARGSRESLGAQVAGGPRGRLRRLLPEGRARRREGPRDGLDRAGAARSRPRLRIDANGSWTIPQALRNLRAMGEYDIDFVEQPVRDHPVGQLAEVRARIEHDRLRQRRSLVGGRCLRSHPSPRRRCLLLLSLLGRIDRQLSSALLVRASRRATGLQAHPRRARAGGRG